MPFKSIAQIIKFTRLEAEGKVPKGTVARWKRETPNLDRLPKKVKKTKE